MKTILVTGATGFIGRNIAEYYASSGKYRVIGVYNKRPPFEFPNLEWIHADLTQPEDVDRVMSKIDILIQAAATTSGSKDIINRPHIHTTDNAVMNSLLFRAAFENNIEHVVFFSCTVMYQSSEKALREIDFDPNLELHPRYFGVGWTKLYVEKMCEFYSRIGKTKFTSIRHSNIYGPHDKFDLERSHVFGATITKVMSAKDSITVWGTGEESRDLLYVDDLISMVDKTINYQKAPYGLFNCGYGEPITIRNLVEKIVEKSGKGLAIEHDLSQPTIKTSLYLDCNKAKKDLGWERRISLDEGISLTIAWWLKNFPS